MAKVICQICGKDYWQLTSHILRIHKISIPEYKECYPGSEIIAEEVYAKLRKHAAIRRETGPAFGWQKGVSHNKGKIPWNKGLTKETDSRIEDGAKKLRGKIVSRETRKKLSRAMTKNQHYDHCVLCRKAKSPTTRRLCQSCAGKKRMREYPNPMSGKKLSDAHIKALWAGRGRKLVPNKPETIVLGSYPGLVFTGNGTLWLKFQDGRRKNPDFIWVNESFRIAIEVFGDYWHKGEDTNELVGKYEAIGWRCLVLWEREINGAEPFDLCNRINEFVNYDEYFPYCLRDDPWFGSMYIPIQQVGRLEFIRL